MLFRFLWRCNRRLGLQLLMATLFTAGHINADETAQYAAFDELLARLQHHPALFVSSSEQQLWLASADAALGLPNPNFTLGFNNVPVNEPTSFDRYLPSNRSLEFKQTIPSLEGREALRSTHLARSALARLEHQMVMAELRKRLITALAEQRRITHSKAALDQQLALLSELERWLKGEMAGGEAVYSRFDELDVQKSKIEEKKLTLTGEAGRWGSELRSLVDSTPSTVPLPQIRPGIWSGNPEDLIKVRIAMAKLTVAQSQVKERRSAFNPDYAFSAAWQQRESSETFDGDDWFTLKLTASLPLWSSANQTPKLKAAEAKVTMVLARQNRQLRLARSDYETALTEYNTALELRQAMLERQSRLQALEAANQRRYEAGDIDLEAVIRPAMQLAELNLDLAGTEAKQTIATARINALLVEERL